MGNDDIGFSEIQEMFANREKKSSTELVPSKSNIIQLRDEPAYENMHATNIKITKKGYEAAKNNKLSLKVGRIIAIAIVITALAVAAIEAMLNESRPIVPLEPTTTTSQPAELPGDDEAIVEIDAESVDLSNMVVVLRQSTSNVKNIVNVAERELDELGIDNAVINYKDDLVENIAAIKKENPGKEIILINVDGVTNRTSVSSVIMTNYDEKSKSADALALAINNSNEGIYNIDSEIRSGKKDVTTAKRVPTSVEKHLLDSNNTDVMAITIAPSMSFINEEVEENNLATSIVEGIIRYATLSEQEKNANYIARVESADTLSEIAEENGVTEEFVRLENRETLSSNNGILREDTALIVKETPHNLTSDVTVKNKTVTTDPNDITVVTKTYEVRSGDVLSQIAEDLNISINSMTVPSGNKDKIYPGDIISYDVVEGKILVSKTTGKLK